MLPSPLLFQINLHLPFISTGQNVAVVINKIAGGGCTRETDYVFAINARYGQGLVVTDRGRYPNNVD
jgi:hypothetical protein